MDISDDEGMATESELEKAKAEAATWAELWQVSLMEPTMGNAHPKRKEQVNKAIVERRLQKDKLVQARTAIPYEGARGELLRAGLNRQLHSCTTESGQAIFEKKLLQLNQEVSDQQGRLTRDVGKLEEACLLSLKIYKYFVSRLVVDRAESKALSDAKAILDQHQKQLTRAKEEEEERKRCELVAQIKREAREEIKAMRELRRGEHVEARRASMAAHRTSERRGGKRCSGKKPKRRSLSRDRDRDSVVIGLCTDLCRMYDLIINVGNALLADVIPANVFTDVVSIFRSQRRPCLEYVSSSAASPVLLVSTLCTVHKRNLQVWRAGACHIDGMCRLGYG